MIGIRKTSIVYCRVRHQQRVRISHNGSPLLDLARIAEFQDLHGSQYSEGERCDWNPRETHVQFADAILRLSAPPS